MLGSDYRELIVPRLDNHAKKYGMLIGGIALTAATVLYALVSGSFWILLISAALGFGTWYFWMQNSVEYEYVISSDELQITKILAESKRKPMLTVTLDKFTAFGRLREAENISSSATTVLACTAQDDTAFCADFDHPEYGQTRLIWTPNDDILLYLVKKLPRSIGFRWEATEPAEQ
ncbi:MAG: hypothetical protein IKI45_17630 [Oscillospiraceae bacterium]|nr:hypothetical protein [Oscillospiraceae bacterium]